MNATTQPGAEGHAVAVLVREIRRLPDTGNLKGFAVVELGPWIIRGCRIIQQPGQRAYVALPQEKAADGRYYPILQTQDLSLKETIQVAVLRAWGRENHDDQL